MRASTASSTGRWLARKTTPSATTCPAPSPNGTGEVVRAAVRRRSFSCAGPWPSVPRMGGSPHAGTFEVDLMLFRAYGQAVLTMHERHLVSASPCVLGARPPNPSPASCPRFWLRCHPGGAGPSPLTTAPSSHVITDSTPGASRPSSAICTPPGRRVAWKTPSGACVEVCSGRRIGPVCRRNDLPSWCRSTTTRRANAWAIGRRLKYWQVKYCT